MSNTAVKIDITDWGWSFCIESDSLAQIRSTGVCLDGNGTRYKQAMIAALRQLEALGCGSAMIQLPGDCGLFESLDMPNRFWRDVVQMMDEVGVRVDLDPMV